jgi:hypothetical protein
LLARRVCTVFFCVERDFTVEPAVKNRHPRPEQQGAEGDCPSRLFSSSVLCFQGW